jgi:carotenoid cleavage dioxygenase-like enzyme
MNAGRDGSRYIAGNLGPVDREVTIDESELTVTGTLPKELSGRYLRIGPNPVKPIDPATHHWFIGDGMVHGLRLDGGKALWYRNRWTRTPATLEALGEPPREHAIVAGRQTSVANTNVIGHAGRTFAIVEAGGAPCELTYELDTVGCTDFDGRLPGAFSAHPKMDPSTSRLHTVGYFWAQGPMVQYIVMDPNAQIEFVQDIAIPSGANPMMHELSITQTRAVLYDLPCVFDIEAAMGGSRLPYRWKPELGARIGLLPLNGGDVIWCELDEPRYVFHSYTAFDGPNGTVIMDCVVHPRMFHADLHGPDEGIPVTERWTIDPSTRTVSRTVLHTVASEFPRVDERLVGRQARYGLSVGIGKAWQHGSLVRTDFETGAVETISHGEGRGTMETVFVPRTPTSAETDGWLMSMVHDSNTQQTDLVLLDAGEPSAPPVATVRIPARVPYGFHGNWVPD